MKRKLSYKAKLMLAKIHIVPAVLAGMFIVATIYFATLGEEITWFHFLVLVLAMVYMVYKIMKYNQVLRYLASANIKKATRTSYIKYEKKYFGLTFHKYQYTYVDLKNETHKIEFLSIKPWRKEYSSEKRVLFFEDKPSQGLLLTQEYNRFIISISHVYIK